MNRTCRRIVLTLCLLALARVSPAAPVFLDDSTTVDRWTLPNGLEVVVRHVPRARAVSLTWGYRIGLNEDPINLPGWTSLLAEVAFTAPAGETPERTRAEMADLRAQGWSLRVNRRQSLFTETATPAQFPGVLHQVARRMRGVTVTPGNLRRSLATVREALEEKSRGVTEAALYWQVREHARGTGPEQLAVLAEAKGLERIKPDSVQRALARAYVPANGVLALAGDFAGLDLHAILAAEFAGLPAGQPLPEPPAPHLTAAQAVVERPGVTRPVGVVGLFAPALTDTMHPCFYTAMLLLGSQAKQQWGAPLPPLQTRFQYALLDDPGFVCFYPRLQPVDGTSPRGPSARLDTLVLETSDVMILPDDSQNLHDNVLWLLGGALPRALLDGMRRDPAALNVLSSTTASRALWGSDEFWSEYRRRFDLASGTKLAQWNRWLRDQRLRASLMAVPPR